MPYGIRKRGNKWVLLNTETMDVKGTHESEEKAKRQMRLLQAIEHNPDWRPK